MVLFLVRQGEDLLVVEKLPLKNMNQKRIQNKEKVIIIKNGLKKIENDYQNTTNNGRLKMLINGERPNVIMKKPVNIMTPSIN